MTEVAASAPLRWIPDIVQLTAVGAPKPRVHGRLAMIAEAPDADTVG